MTRARIAAGLGFARRIAARHGRVGVRSPSLAFVLRRTPSASRSILQRIASLTTRVFAPRLGPFHLYQPGRAAAANSRFPTPPLRSLRPLERVPTRSARLERSSLQRGRAEHSPRRAPRALLRSVTERVARTTPIPRVLRKSPDPHPTGTEELRPSRPTHSRHRETAQPVALAPAEMERLTSHVLHTLDRRLGAFRERRGKV